eukprot:scaffold3825_cov225-Pinguiococcus_pyrenoidosus.AAC.2
MPHPGRRGMITDGGMMRWPFEMLTGSCDRQTVAGHAPPWQSCGLMAGSYVPLLRCSETRSYSLLLESVRVFRPWIGSPPGRSRGRPRC